MARHSAPLTGARWKNQKHRSNSGLGTVTAEEFPTTTDLQRITPIARATIIVPVFIVVLGALLDWTVTAYPAELLFWMPYDFSWLVWLGTWFPIWWYLRGISLLPKAERPNLWRQAAFLLGITMMYVVLQTRYLYLAEHQFFLNRIQHVIMHHLGPFLVALAFAGKPLRLGMPYLVNRFVNGRVSRLLVAPFQQPVVASILFAGLVAFWLLPAIHFVAMVNHLLFWIMNWSMILDGLLFWCLVLDPRPAPPARARYGVRVAMAWAVIFPQILIGALIVFAGHDIYPYYNYCGRLFPSIGPLTDQLVGGIVVWIPPAMMSAVAGILVLNHMRLHEETLPLSDDPRAARIAAMAAKWTGRPNG
jgi:putative membrane protein